MKAREASNMHCCFDLLWRRRLFGVGFARLVIARSYTSHGPLTVCDMRHTLIRWGGQHGE